MDRPPLWMHLPHASGSQPVNAPHPAATFIPLLITLLVLCVGAWLYRHPQHGTHARRLYSSALSASLIASFALFAGAVLEFKSTEVLTSRPLSYAAGSPVPAAVVFWVIVALLVALGYAYYRATNQQREEWEADQREADRERATQIREARDTTLASRDHTSRLIEHLRTLPPERFLQDFPRSCRSLMASYTEAIVEDAEDASRRAIRTALLTVSGMARAFDRGDRGEVFSANVMRYHSEDDLPLATWSEEDWSLYPKGFRPDVIEGSLILDPELSSYAEGGEPVPGLAPIRLVIPHPRRNAGDAAPEVGKLRVLPGAALAFVLGIPYTTTDTLKIRESVAGEDLALDEALIARTEWYFQNGPGRSIRSFVSIPLRTADSCVGVLNVESSQPEIFGGNEERVRQFALAIAPVHFVIEALLANLESPEPSTGHAENADGADL